MTERKPALLFFQEDIDEAFQLWLSVNPEVNITLPFTFKIRQMDPRNTVYELVPTSQYLEHTKLEWNSAVAVKQADLETAMGLLLGKRTPGNENIYWMRIYLGKTLEIAMIPHSNHQKFTG